MPLDIPWPFPEGHLKGRTLKALVWRCGTNVTLFLVGGLSKIWMQRLNNTTVHNGQRWIDAVERREKGKPLITICNHNCNVDDPLLFGLLPFRLAFRPSLLRWGFGASNVCFSKESHGAFMARGKIIPVHRGDGVYQRGVNQMLERLDAGEWGHVFPEGKVNLTREWMRLKWGVGRLVADCKVPPLVIPFWHEGLDDVMPNSKPYFPRVGQNVTVVFGNVIDTRELLERLQATHSSAESLRKAVTEFLQDELATLRDRTRRLHTGDLSDLHRGLRDKDVRDHSFGPFGNFNESNSEERLRKEVEEEKKTKKKKK